MTTAIDKLGSLTQSKVSSLSKSKPQTILISCQHTKSALKVANYIANEISPKIGGVIKIDADGGSIKIDQIRLLYKHAYSKKSNEEKDTVTFILNNAQKLTIPAQNALLKLLEEPPAKTHLILVAKTEESLLPTIVSRTQRLRIEPLSFDRFSKFFRDEDATTTKKLYAASSGFVIYAEDLLKESNPLSSIDKAKAILSLPLDQAVIKIATFSTSRENAEIFIDSLITVIDSAISSKTTKSKLAWVIRLEACINAKDHLSKNGPSKLILDNLLLEIR